MVPGMLEISSFARGSNLILRPIEEDCGLRDVQGPRAFLEHLWNKNVVHPWGSLVTPRSFRCGAARTISLGWGRLVTLGNGWRRGLVALPRRRSPVRIWCSAPNFQPGPRVTSRSGLFNFIVERREVTGPPRSRRWRPT
jgi:hypothetical protein